MKAKLLLANLVVVMARIYQSFCAFPSNLLLPCMKELSILLSWTFTKSVVLLLIWNSMARMIYDAYLLAPDLQAEGSTCWTMIITAVLSVINILSPLDGYLGDMKFSRFGILKCSACFMIAATSIGLFSGTIVEAIYVYSTSMPPALWYIVMIILLGAIFSYMLGYLLFSFCALSLCNAVEQQFQQNNKCNNFYQGR